MGRVRKTAAEEAVETGRVYQGMFFFLSFQNLMVYVYSLPPYCAVDLMTLFIES